MDREVKLKGIDKNLIREIEIRDEMKYHVADSFINVPWSFNSKNQYAGKIFFAIISMIDFNQDYSGLALRFNYNDVCNSIGIKRVGMDRFELFSDALHALKNQVLKINLQGTVISEDGKEKQRIVKGECGWISEYLIDNLTAETDVVLPNLLRPIILNLKNVAFKGSVQNSFKALMPMSSQYFIHLYLLILEKAIYPSKIGGYWKPSLEELYNLLCVPASYRTWGNFEQRVLMPFVSDIKNNDNIRFLVCYEPINAERKENKRGRSSVVSVKFWTISKTKVFTRDRGLLEDSKEKDTADNVSVVQELLKNKLLEFGIGDKQLEKILSRYDWIYIGMKIEDCKKAFAKLEVANKAGYFLAVLENGYESFKGEHEKSDIESIKKLLQEESDLQIQSAMDRVRTEHAEIMREMDDLVDILIKKMTDMEKLEVLEQFGKSVSGYAKKTLLNKYNLSDIRAFELLLSSQIHGKKFKKTLLQYFSISRK